jgi:outer membrane protein insertion porin family
VTYELLWRTITDTSNRASPAIVAQKGQFLKSALAYTYHLDRLDSQEYPLQGWACRCDACGPMHA